MFFLTNFSAIIWQQTVLFYFYW